MDILVIGNGFDIAHKLPTKYEHFLKFVKIYKKYKEFELDYDYDDEEINISYFSDLETQQEEIFEELNELILNNVWLEYFLNIFDSRIKEGKDGWIDFESEIRDIIKLIDNDMKNSVNMHDIVKGIPNKFFSNYFLDNLEEREQARDIECYKLCRGMSKDKQTEFIKKYNNEHPVIALKPAITYDDLIMTLENDLNRLIRALEIYLTDYVGSREYNLISPDIKKIVDATKRSVKVISFNYTDTYERNYLGDFARFSSDKMNYIHGKADISNSLETNNIVLGIDEYLKKKERNKRVEFIAFKKYYQRIYKQTGCKYKEWVNKIIKSNDDYKESLRLCKQDLEKNSGMGGVGYNTKEKLKKLLEKPPKHNLYIFGHSLDVTDKDILKELILNDYVHTTIFYYNKKAMGRQIANLVKVIGQNELIRRTGAKTIVFKLQADMVKNHEEKPR